MHAFVAAWVLVMALGLQHFCVAKRGHDKGLNALPRPHLPCLTPFLNKQFLPVFVSKDCFGFLPEAIDISLMGS